MSILDERDEYLKNPYFEGHEYGNFSPFYVGIAICSVIGGLLFILNIAFCWCSPHRKYWQDRHTGNRWIQTLWTVTPHKTPPLDLSELESGLSKYPPAASCSREVAQYHDSEPEQRIPQLQQYTDLQKRESEI